MQKPAKSVFILNSALTSKLSLELTYRDLRRPAPKNVGPQTPDPREAQPLARPNRELLALCRIVTLSDNAILSGAGIDYSMEHWLGTLVLIG